MTIIINHTTTKKPLRSNNGGPQQFIHVQRDMQQMHVTNASAANSLGNCLPVSVSATNIQGIPIEQIVQNLSSFYIEDEY